MINLIVTIWDCKFIRIDDMVTSYHGSKMLVRWFVFPQNAIFSYHMIHLIRFSYPFRVPSIYLIIIYVKYLYGMDERVQVILAFKPLNIQYAWGIFLVTKKSVCGHDTLFDIVHMSCNRWF